MKILLEGIVGSVAYNLATPQSDVDTAGVFMNPLSKLLSLTPGSDTIQYHNPDKVLHELSKFVSLLVKANPSVLEYLWLNNYNILDPSMKPFLDNREMFFTTKVVKSYLGFVNGQLKRFLNNESQILEQTPAKIKKHGRHIIRLLTQLDGILTTGTLKVALTDEQASYCFSVGDLAYTDTDNFIIQIEDFISNIKSIDHSFPDEIDFAEIDKIIFPMRLSYLI